MLCVPPYVSILHTIYRYRVSFLLWEHSVFSMDIRKLMVNLDVYINTDYSYCSQSVHLKKIIISSSICTHVQ